MNVGIVGATGYTGSELCRWVLEHPVLRLTAVTSGRNAGSRLDEALPRGALSRGAQVGRFGKLRACSDVLGRGTYEPLAFDRERLVFARRYAGRVAIVIATRRPTTPAATLELDPQQTGSLDGRYVDALDASAGTFDVRGGALALTTPSLSLRVLLPEGDACAR